MSGPQISNGLNVELLGQGPVTTVLLHGFLGSGKNLRPLARLWAERDPTRTFVVVDLPGHGGSMPLSSGETMDSMARAVLEGVRELQLPEPFALVGHSLGGRVALAAMSLEPTLVGSATLLDIGPGAIEPKTSEGRRVLDILLDAPDVVPDRIEMRAFLMGRGLSKALADWIIMNLKLRSSDDPPEFTWRIDRQALDRLHASFNSADLWHTVERFGSKIACVRGERSTYVSAEDLRRMEQLGVRTHTLAGAGHYVHVDALGSLVEWLLEL